MLRIYPGYRIADGGEPVARARRVERRPREQSAEWLNFPEAARDAPVRATDLPTAVNPWPGKP